MRRRHFYLTSLVACLFLGLSLHAAASSLENAEAFAVGGIGFIGTTSENEKTLRAILDKPDAVARLEKLLPHASRAGQLYILPGLRLKDREAYQRTLAACAEHDGQVETIRGCIISHEAFRNAVHEIDKGNFDALMQEKAR